MEKRTQIVRVFKALTADSPLPEYTKLLTVRRQPLNPTQVSGKLHVQLKEENHINVTTNRGFDMDLNYA